VIDKVMNLLQWLKSAMFLRQTSSSGKEIVDDLLLLSKAAATYNNARQIKDLSATVSAAGDGVNTYLIRIHNNGIRVYKDITIGYAHLLLSAESFGQDDRCLSVNTRVIDGEPFYVKSLSPGESATAVRVGYDSYQYYSSKQEVLFLQFGTSQASLSSRFKYWMRVSVNLSADLDKT
jgi:hypothetical protein